MTTAVAKKIEQSEAMINDSPRTFTDADFPVGTTAHQGDLILVRLLALPGSARPSQRRQMAEGSTQGSRHILSVGQSFECKPEDVRNAIADVCRGVEIADQYIGPVFQAVDDNASLTHPEHGDHHFVGNMVIACVYQRSLDSEEREQRVRD